jgi:hypothetical protein
MNISDKILTLRGKQVILDRDLAELYEVSTKALNQAVKRNKERFPEDFMFQLTEKEYCFLRSQIVTLKNSILKSQIVTSNSLRFKNETLNKGRGEHRKYLPYAFTEHGVAALSGVLRSSKAVSVNIQIIRAFVAMRKFIVSNAQIFQRLDAVELKQVEYDKQFNSLFKAIESKDLIPSKGIFFDGEVFDAHVFVSNIVKKARKSIILIDNYIDESILTLFSKKKKTVSLHIYTKNIDKKLRLDVYKFSKQYGEVFLKEFHKSHDRFLIIDEKDIYHFGASLKDLGKKWFAFSKFDASDVRILEKINY